MREEELALQVERLLRLYGWTWCHFRPARTSKGWRTAITGHTGFPDYVAVRDAKMLVFELKGDKGRNSEAQKAWLVELIGVSIVVGLHVPGIVTVKTWWPTDWDEIVETLKREE